MSESDTSRTCDDVRLMSVKRSKAQAVLAIAFMSTRPSQNLRASLSSGPPSRREQQIVNLVVARHWNARYPWFAQVRASLAAGIDQAVIDAINARKTPSLADARERTCFAVASELLAKGAQRRKLCLRGKDDGAGEPGGAGRIDRQFFDDLPDRRHVRDRSAARQPDPAGGIARHCAPVTTQSMASDPTRR
jgi:hypothetical protein